MYNKRSKNEIISSELIDRVSLMTTPYEIFPQLTTLYTLEK